MLNFFSSNSMESKDWLFNRCRFRAKNRRAPSTIKFRAHQRGGGRRIEAAKECSATEPRSRRSLDTGFGIGEWGSCDLSLGELNGRCHMPGRDEKLRRAAADGCIFRESGFGFRVCQLPVCLMGQWAVTGPSQRAARELARACSARLAHPAS